MKTYFAHERLEAYQRSLTFAAWCEPLLDRIPKTAAVQNQLDRARTSIPLNIAEGNAKFTPADKCKFFDNAHGSAVESAACLDLLFIKKAVSEAELDEGKTLLSGLAGLLIGLIKSKIPDRYSLREEEGEYGGSESRSENENGRKP